MLRKAFVELRKRKPRRRCFESLLNFSAVALIRKLQCLVLNYKLLRFRMELISKNVFALEVCKLSLKKENFFKKFQSKRKLIMKKKLVVFN